MLWKWNRSYSVWSALAGIAGYKDGLNGNASTLLQRFTGVGCYKLSKWGYLEKHTYEIKFKKWATNYSDATKS